MSLNLGIDNYRPERVPACRACNWDPWVDDGEAPAHSCRSAPTEPRCERQERRRISARILLDRELQIRRTTLAERGRARA
jgi:hypothetical protein